MTLYQSTGDPPAPGEPNAGDGQQLTPGPSAQGRAGRAGLLSVTAALLVMVGTLLWQEQRAVAQLPGLALPTWTVRLALPSLLIGIGLLAASKAIWRVLGLVAGVFSFMLVGDRAFLAYFQQPLSAEMAVAVRQLWDVGESTGSLVEPLDWAALTVVLVCFYIVSRRPVRGAARLAGLALALSAVPATSDALSWAMAPGVGEAHGQVVRRAEDTGLLLFHLDDVVDGIARRLDDEPLDEATQREVLALFARRQALNATRSPLFGIAAGRNVVHVQIEAFQHFLLDWTGPDGEVTPLLNRFAEAGLSFEHMMDTSRMGRTSSAEFQVMTGMPSHTRELAAYSLMGQPYTTLPSVLAEHGYSTWSMHAFRRDFWNRAVAHPTYGIQHMLFDDAWDAGRNVGWGLGDMDFLAQAADRLAGAEAPFFAHIITLSCHHPFSAVPTGMLSWDTGLPGDEGRPADPDASADAAVADSQPLMASGYLRLARYTDEALGGFMRAMRTHGLADETLFVFYGDHDAGLDGPSREVLTEQGGRDLSHPAEDRVPCVILIPGQEEALATHGAAFRSQFVGLHDLPATVLHLLGIEPPAGLLGTHAFVPEAQRDVMPLFLGDSLVADGELLSGWDLPADDPDDVARRATRRVQARALSRLTDLALDHALQPVATKLPPEELERLATLPVAGMSPDLPRPTTGWERTDLGEPRPLPRRIIDGLPRSNATLFQVRLVLRNQGLEDATWAYEALGINGQSVRTLGGTLPPGDTFEVPLAPVLDGEAGVLGLLDAPDEVRADVRIQREMGVTWRRAHRDTYPESRWVGSADGIASLALVLANASDTPRTAEARLNIDGVEHVRWDTTVPPRSKSLQLFDMSNESREVSVVVLAEGVTTDLLAWDQAGTTLR